MAKWNQFSETNKWINRSILSLQSFLHTERLIHYMLISKAHFNVWNISFILQVIELLFDIIRFTMPLSITERPNSESIYFSFRQSYHAHTIGSSTLISSAGFGVGVSFVFASASASSSVSTPSYFFGPNSSLAFMHTTVAMTLVAAMLTRIVLITSQRNTDINLPPLSW